MRLDFRKEGTQRLVTWLLLFMGLAFALLLRQWVVFIFDAIVVILVWFCVFEVFRAKKLDSKGLRDYYMYPYIALAYLLFLLGILVENPFSFGLHVVLQAVLLFTLCLYVFFMSYTDKEFVKECRLRKNALGKESGKVVWEYLKIILYPTLLLFMLIPLNHLGENIALGARPEIDGLVVEFGQLGLFALLLVFCITIATDTLAYGVGKIFKGKKLIPSISPGKTWSGAIGGLFGGVLASLTVLLIMVTSEPIRVFLTAQIGNARMVNVVFFIIGFFGSIIVQAGDIYASWIKRKNGIKDFGRWLPGHGGLMDRFDGLAFNATFISFVFMILVLI